MKIINNLILLVTYCYVTNYPNAQWLKTIPSSYISQFCGLNFGGTAWLFDFSAPMALAGVSGIQ